MSINYFNFYLRFQIDKLDLHRFKTFKEFSTAACNLDLTFSKIRAPIKLMFWLVQCIFLKISSIPSFFRDTYLSNVDRNRMSGYPRVSIRLEPRAVEVLLQGKLGHLHINIRERHLLYLICHCDVMRASLSLSTLRSAQQICHSQWGSSAHNEPIRRRRVTACHDWLDANRASPLAGIGFTLWTKLLTGWSNK